ncbi:hypothetical protein HU200_049557 [Digitaria exilis]|uniref:Uncharacterized protein n=1 Tax=Digitaria exilis TaxID=1010633 RepID=A0A835AVX5_9POAL|nr:hypothetical protein HU200_049557 [Digitaria exilis]
MAQPTAASSSASGRRRGQRKIVGGWDAVFCFAGGSRRARGEQALAVAAEGTPLWRKQRTVPVDGDPADRDVMRRGAGDGNGAHDKQRRLEHTKPRSPRSPSELSPAPSQSQAITDDSRCRREEQPRGGGAPAETTRARAAARSSDNEASSKTREAPARGWPCHPKASASASAGGEGAFGPVVGLSVVAAVSMAGLLGGRLWAVACVCAWLAALSRLTRRAGGSGTAGSDGGGEETVADDVDSTDYKKLVVLRGLLERDRTKAGGEPVKA